ncbi:Cytochrome c oxidase (cbb3-type) subunit CcoO [hydrothermal vent metagenome]|uniref:Cytochrome c oxidase (Cbb3-type) subunit CcoO n=1 Tax=hydrothermal vent metagenome TaxID=652676 RepID=A0A3B1AIC0_9ZZZZ
MLVNMFLRNLFKKNNQAFFLANLGIIFSWLRALWSMALMILCVIFFLIPITAQAQSSNAQYHEQGRAIYNYRCYFCHGYSGDAKTLTSSYVYPAPLNFKQINLKKLSRQKMLNAVTHGKVNTAMTAFSRVLNANEIRAVVDFIRLEFMKNKQSNSQYHTNKNGWPNHQRYALAFPFAKGDIALDTAWTQLTPELISGKKLYLSSCISCHDRANVINEGDIWKKQSISYPRNNYSHTKIDLLSSASVYAKHDISPKTKQLSISASSGKIIWLKNCAFCHAADGSGQNWIGSFLEPNPRDLRQEKFMKNMTREKLQLRIQNGIKNSSMPAWKNVLSKKQIDQLISYISEAFYPLESNSQFKQK